MSYPSSAAGHNVLDISRMADPERFRQHFGPHFPHILDDKYDLTSLIFAFEISVEADWGPVRRSEAKKKLRHIRSWLKGIAQSRHILLRILIKQRIEKLESNYGADELGTFLTWLMLRSEDELNAVLDRFIADTTAEIEAAPDKRNIDWKAVRAVGSLRFLWVSLSGEKQRPRKGSQNSIEGQQIDPNERLRVWAESLGRAPSKALNPASKFARFLRDGFRYLEVEGNPESAFRRWAEINRTGSKK